MIIQPHIYVPMFCSSVPDKIRELHEKNEKVSSLVNYDLQREPYAGGFAGLMAEKRKAELLLSHDNVMVIDWDVELLGFENDLKPGFYVGTWKKSKNIDGFLMYKKGNQFDSMIKEYLNKIPLEYWQIFLSSKRHEVSKYPEKLYRHYNFGFGRSVKCIDTIDKKTVNTIIDIKMRSYR